MLKAITKVESGFNPNAISEAGAKGLNQIMPSNFKALGITDPFDPRQNIMGSAQLLAEYMRASGGDLQTALTMYHGGYKRSGWGERTRAYAGKVFAAMESQKQSGNEANLTGEYFPPQSQRIPGAVISKEPYGDINTERPEGAASYPTMMADSNMSVVKAPAGRHAPVAGQGRENVQLRGIQEALAGYLGVPVEQVMQGFVNKGDIDFARQYLRIGTERDYIKNMQLAKTPGVRPNVQAEAYKNARAAAFQLSAFDKFGAQISERARPGGQDITLGQKNITININEASDPRSTGYAVQDILRQDDINDINNLTADAVKW